MAGTSSRKLHKGPISSRTKETDGSFLIPGYSFVFPSGTWTATRVAQGDIRMRKTAAAATANAVVNLNDQLMKKVGLDPTWDTLFGTAPTVVPADIAHDIRGFQVVSIDVVYAIGTTPLTTHTGTLTRTTYANTVAPVVAAVGGALAGALATAINAQPFVTTLTPAAPFILGNNLVEVMELFELSIQDPGTTIYDLIGIEVKGNYNIL